MRRGAQRRELLDRLVRRPVLAEPDAVVGEDERRRDPHQRGEPDRRLHVVAEDQEAGPERAEAGEHEAVDDRPHPELADAEVQVAIAVAALLHAAAVVDQRQRRGREVGGAAHQLGHVGGHPLDDVLRGLAGGDHAGVRALLGHVGVPARRRAAVDDDALEVGGQLRELGLVGLEAAVPLLHELVAAADRLAEVRERLVGHEERLLARPAVGLLGEADLLVAERRAVRPGGVLLVRRADRDVAADDDQARLLLVAARVRERLLDALQRHVLAEVLDVPAVGLVALADVLAHRERGVALDRDVVVVVEDGQPAEAEVAGEGARLVADALLHIAVGRDHVRVVIDDVVAGAVEAGGEHALGEREPDAHGDALAERAGRRLDPRRVAVLGMAGGRRAELAEVLEVVQREAVAAQVERAVQQHRRVAGAEHEAVAIRPLGMRGRVLHHPRVEHVRERRERHRRPRVAGVRLLDSVHRQRPDRVDAELIERRRVFCDGHEAS